MSVIQSGHPFSMKWNSIRQGAGGMSIAQAMTEGYDNDIDALAKVTYTKSWVDLATQTTYLLNFNDGNGLDDLPHLFGLGAKTPKKAETMIGNFNHGHAAMVGFFNPTSYHAYSKTTSSASSVLDFNVQGFDNGVSSISRGGNSDYRSVDIKDYISVSPSVDEINSTLTHIANHTVHAEMKTFLKQIIAGTAPHFMLNLYTFKNGHRFSKEVLDTEIANTFPSLYLTYHEPLSKGYSILTEFNIIDETTKCYMVKKADSSKVLSPICSSDIFPAIIFGCTLYSSDKEDYLHINVGLLENDEDRDLYLTTKPDDSRKTVNTMHPVITCRDYWKTPAFKKQGSFRFDVNCPSEEVGASFSNSLGTDLNGVDNTRGIYTRYMGRGGGKPFWMPGGTTNGGWPAARNSGRIGALLVTNSKRLTEDHLGLQSNKHNTSLSSAHSLIKRFLTIVMTGIINKYTNPKAPTSKTGVKKWILSDICDILMDKKKIKTTTSPPALVSGASAPGQASSPSSDTLSDSADDMAEASSTTSPRNTNPMPSLSTTVVGPHVRTQPQSESNLIDQLIAFYENHTLEDLRVLKSVASRRTMDGYAEKCRWVQELNNDLNSLKQR